MRTRLSVRVLAACVALCLGGCATDRIRPDPSAARKDHHYTLPVARAYASEMRSAYQQMVDHDQRTERALGNGLIGLGGVILGLAGFGAHRDAVAGTALLGGTAYAIGERNVSRQRQTVFQAGIEALNCATKAIIPYDVPPARLRRLEGEAAKLTLAIDEVKARTKVATDALAAASQQPKPLRDEADAAIAEARAAASSANELLASAHTITANVHKAGSWLHGAVEDIDLQVDKALRDTYPSLSSIKNVIADLPLFAGALAPGSLVTSRFSSAMVSAGGPKPQASVKMKALGAPASVGTALADATLSLVAETAALRLQVADVRAAMAGFDSAGTAAALASCGINVSFPLSVQPTEAPLKASEEISILIDGGTPGYKVHVQGSKPAGFEFTPPLGRDRTLYVRGTSSLKGPHTVSLLVTDSSESPKAATVTINVPAAEANTPPPAPDANTLVTRLNKLTQQFDVSGISVKLEPPAQALDGGKVQITMECLSTPGTPLPQATIRDELVKQMVDGSTIEADLAAANMTKDAIVIVGKAAGCIAPAPQSRTRLKRSRPRATVPR